MTVLSLADAKDHLRVDGADEDALIAGLIMAAEDHVERVTGLVLERRTAVEAITGFGGRIRSWPVISVDRVEFVDSNGMDRDLPVDAYQTVQTQRPARLRNLSAPWPVLTRLNGLVTVTMTAGYADPSEVPAGIRQALKMFVGHFYANREAVVTAGNPVEVPMAVEMLLSPHCLRLT